MGKKILDSKALYIFLSVVISIALWFYVTSLDGNLNTKPIRNIPITFAGQDILEERGLMIISATPTASVEVRATPAVLWKLTDDTVRLTVDVSQITEAAEYRLAYTASLPSGVSQSDVEFVEGKTGNVTFTVARYTTREVEVRGKFVGSVAEGYLAGEETEFIFAPKTIKISGQANLVNQVDHILVSVGGNELKSDVAGLFAYQLIGVSGEALTDLDVVCSDDSIYVTYPIWATAEIDLGIKFITGGGISENTINYTMSTNKITVKGTKEAIDSIKDGTINLATINLANVRDGDELVYTIPLADELTNISGVTEVTVTIDLPENLVSQTVEVSEFSFINEPEEGWLVQTVTQVLPLEIRGLSHLMTDLTADNLRVVIDLKDVNLAPGQYSVPVKIYLDSVGTSEQIGVMGVEHKVVISISEAPVDRQTTTEEQE